MKKFSSILLACAGFVSMADAAESTAPEIWTRSERFHAEYRVNADGTHVRTFELAAKAVHEKGLERLRTLKLSHSSSVEALEVLDAHTRKAGGRKIKVPKGNYQVEVNKGQDGSPAFSDNTTVTLVFPELAVGDSTVVRYRVTQKEPIFPGHFALRYWFGRGYAYDDMRIVVDAPLSLEARHESKGMVEEAAESKGRRRVSWTWNNPNPIKETRRDWSVFDPEGEVGLSYSTYDSYEQIAQAYGARARPKAVPNDRVRKLAAEIVGTQKGTRDQARALYDWVATKIAYAGNCIGVGVVVPRDLDFVLDNKMGDCKDHATLLQALLTAQGIASTQALVNSGNFFKLPRIPDVSSVNHVINYIPELDLFVDSTSDSTPFGMLPHSVQHKPVLLVDGFKEGLRTPHTKPGTNRQHARTVMDIGADGTLTATLEVRHEGQYAADARASMRQLAKDRETEIIEQFFEGAGLKGTGTLEKDDPTALLDRYRYAFKIEVKNFVARPGAGALNIGTPMPTPAPVMRYVYSGFATDAGFDVACSSGTSVEEYVYRFPKGMEILSVPDNFKLANAFLTYEATYKLKGRELTVMRMMDDRSPGGVCGADINEPYREFSQKVLPNLKAQILYK